MAAGAQVFDLEVEKAKRMGPARFEVFDVRDGMVVIVSPEGREQRLTPEQARVRGCALLTLADTAEAEGGG